MAHEIPYVATATVAELRDPEYKVEKAMTFRGARYLHVRALLAGLGPPKDTIRLARLVKETGLFPVFEAEHGQVTEALGRSVIRVPVEEALLQRRFAHLFGENPRPDIVARIQAGADHNIERFGLLAGEGEGAELPGA